MTVVQTPSWYNFISGVKSMAGKLEFHVQDQVKDQVSAIDVCVQIQGTAKFTD